MAQSKGTKASDPLKIAGGTLLLVGSIALMIHQMPSRGYVEVHADKPRPMRAADHAAPAPAPAAAQPVPAAVFRPLSTPASRALEQSALHAHESETAPAAVPVRAPARAIGAEELADDCRSEAAVLCYNVPTKGIARCLKEYDDALMAPCRRALRSFRSARHPLDEKESGL
jgi:hypothetical protein